MCNFKNNVGGEYGAIDACNNSDGLIILNSGFYSNTATGDGGAISFVATTNNMYGNNLTFDGNSATNGGACKISGRQNSGG